jgi:hypothetical protein
VTIAVFALSYLLKAGSLNIFKGFFLHENLYTSGTQTLYQGLSLGDLKECDCLFTAFYLRQYLTYGYKGTNSQDKVQKLMFPYEKMFTECGRSK